LESKIFLFGYNGFVGTNFLKYSNNILCCNIKDINKLVIEKADPFSAVINFIGKAHDLKNVSSPNDYYSVNTDLTKVIFDAFLESKASVFITLSSVKAVADEVESVLTEDATPNPITHYGKSKLLAEQYILSKTIPEGKRVYILRPCMIHGPGNKGNLNLLYSLVSKGLPWPLGLFENSRSYLSIENLCFIIKELIERDDIQSGVYNLSDDVPLSTNEVIKMIAESKGKKAKIMSFSQKLIKRLARLGDFLKLPLNSERLQKLTESYVVSNVKIRVALGKQLPVSSKDGLIRTFQSFANNA
jgi:nucleoside-diphosphate-sugar epimerase